MRILVTGCSGQVGHELERSLQQLAGQPMEVIALDRKKMDLADPAQIRAVIRSLQPALIVNPAAYTAVDLAQAEPDLAMRINGEAAGVIAEEARECGAALVHYSTDYVFDGGKEGAYVETDPTNPINVYGRTKLAGEQAIAASGALHLILRTSWVYGMRGKNFLKTIERLAAERDQLKIVADQHGAPTWCRTIAQQTARAIEILCSSGTPEAKAQSARAGAEPIMIRPGRWLEDGGIYHLTAQGHTTWHGFASEIVARGPRAGMVEILPIATEAYPVPAPRPRNSRLSCQRFIERFGDLPSWETALAECMGTT